MRMEIKVSPKKHYSQYINSNKDTIVIRKSPKFVMTKPHRSDVRNIIKLNVNQAEIYKGIFFSLIKYQKYTQFTVLLL